MLNLPPGGLQSSLQVLPFSIFYLSFFLPLFPLPSLLSHSLLSFLSPFRFCSSFSHFFSPLYLPFPISFFANGIHSAHLWQAEQVEKRGTEGEQEEPKKLKELRERLTQICDDQLSSLSSSLLLLFMEAAALDILCGKQFHLVNLLSFYYNNYYLLFFSKKDCPQCCCSSGTKCILVIIIIIIINCY